MKCFEKWLPLFDGVYEVSSHGQVRRVHPGNGPRKFVGIMKQNKSRHGYFRVGLRRDLKQKLYLVHRLVAAAFIGPCPQGHETNHKDGDKSNNFWRNLEYLTRKKNAEHAAQLGLYLTGDRHPFHKNPAMAKRGSETSQALINEQEAREIKNLLRLQVKHRVIAQLCKVKTSLVDDIARGRTWKHVHVSTL
jgi:HNH endonuclease